MSIVEESVLESAIESANHSSELAHSNTDATVGMWSLANDV